MKLRYKLLNGFLGLVVLSVAVLAVVISYSRPCDPVQADAAVDTGMKAFTYRCYGSADVLELEDVAIPTPAENEVLVRVQSASVNPLDWHYMRGSPYFMRLGAGIGAPKDIRLGVDFAGTVEAVGAAVTKYRPGDRVFGGRTGAFAEYVIVPEDRAMVAIPEDVTFEQAAAIPIAGLTALQALRDKGDLQPGQKVLINGASGGVGTFAVQIAKAMGAEVHGVCSSRNVELVKSLGADRVWDYKTENYTDSDERYDLIVDMVGNHSFATNRHVLKPDGKLVMVGGPKGDWIAPFKRPLGAMIVAPFVDQEFILLLARLSQDDLTTVAAMVAAGDVNPVIDQRFPLHEVPDAIRYSEAGRARGKILIEF